MLLEIFLSIWCSYLLIGVNFSIVIRFLSLAYFLRFAKLSYNRSKSFVNAKHDLNN